MANGIDWFRWHHGSVTDPKFQLIAKKAGASLPDVLAVWAYLLESASASDVRGQFSDIDAEALDCLFSFPDGRTADILDALGARGLISDNAITSWDKRQPKREREVIPSTAMTGAERVAKHRAAKVALQQSGDHVTPCNATKRQETPREEKSREEEKNQGLNPTVEDKPSTARRRTDPADDSLIVFEYWQRVMDHPQAKLDGKRLKAIKGRLSDGYSVADLCRAVDGCKADPWSQGQNDRNTVYDDIELICRDGPKVDKFKRIAEHGPPQAQQLAPQMLTKAGQATARNIEAWLREKQGHG